MSLRSAAIGLAALACGCATAAKPHVVDLQPARKALEEARAEGAAERAPDTFNRAQGELKEAERLVAVQGADASLAAVEAEWAARLALSEARCAAREQAQAQQPTVEDVRRLETRAKKGEDEQRRLEEQLALRQRELEVTETELIRTKGRLKGVETRAEASSAIAEAEILTGRLDTRGRAGTTRKDAEGELAKAKKLLDEENYGAALFFAMKAQNMVTKVGDSRPAADTRDADKPAPQGTYVVSASSAHIRQSPSTDAPVVGTARQGDPLKALAVRGAWVKVAYGDVTGWVSLKLLR
jgi:hypothetical protein